MKRHEEPTAAPTAELIERLAAIGWDGDDLARGRARGDAMVFRA